MKSVIRALRAPFLAGSLIPVAMGATYAFGEGVFRFFPFLITLMGVAGLHLGANLINDYYDAGGSDPVNVRLTPFSGGSRVIQEQCLSPEAILFMAIGFFSLSMICGIWLTVHGRPLVLLLGFLGLLAGWTYSSPPLQLMSRGFGEIVIFFAFGPLITLGAYYVMSGRLSWPAFMLGIPQGFLILEVIWINQFPDYEADKKTGKKNLVVRLGPEISRILYGLFMIFSFLSIPALIGFMGLSMLVILAFLAGPLAFKATRILWRQYLSHEGVIPAQALTIQTMLVQGLLISLALVLSGLVNR